jgi:pimeloyl-ACP methyl ester carboxylesterase
LLASLTQTLATLGLDTPVDMVGNSLGGQLALVAAREGAARSVVALSPAGLWTGRHAPPQVRLTLKATRLLVKRAPRLADGLLHSPIGRTVAFALPMTSRGWRIDSAEAVAIGKVFREAAEFDSTLAAAERFTGGSRIRVPVTVAFGTRDWLLTRSCQHREELPAQTRWLRPRGWGHVPMWDDPEAVAQLILDGTA